MVTFNACFEFVGIPSLSSDLAPWPLEVIMGKKLYIGNLPYSATEQLLAEKMSECGTVESAKIITDRDSGRSKGFAFVEMSTDAEAQSAISKFDGSDYEGRPMTVNEAKPQAPRENRGGGNRGGGRW